MKKILLILIMASCALCAHGQEFQIQSSAKAQKLAFEYLTAIQRHTFYGYAEVLINDSASSYIQTFYEYNLIKPVSVHAEYRALSMLDSSTLNTFISGVSFNVLSRDYIYLSIAPLYRYEERHQWQMSFIYGASYKQLSFDGYFDLYGDKSIYAFSENKIKFHFDRYFVGVNIEYMLINDTSLLNPYLLFGVKF